MAEIKRILIVEDSLTFRDLIQFCIQNLLDNIKIEFIVLKHGEEAVSYLKKHPNKKIDLIITDIMMPGDISGCDLVLHIRQLDNFMNVPIFLVTGGVDESIQLQTAKNLCTEFFKKPIDIKHLQTKLLKWLKIES